MPSSEAMNAWRFVCSTTPWRASTRTMARSAVDAPVTMLRVYCTWPGVSARMNERRAVAKYRYATSIVIPCSRSARRPSVRRERSSAPSRPWRSSSWSARIALASWSRRPISVDLPSSTEPAVARRSRSDRATDAAPCPFVPWPLEVAGNLAVLHGGLADAVVGAGLAPFGDLRRGDLGHDVVQGGRGRGDRAGAAHVADRAVADARVERLLAVDQLHEGRQRVEHPVAAEDPALVGEVDRRDIEALLRDVLP